MPKPSFETFAASARKSLAKVDVREEDLRALDTKGREFDVYDDGGIDSLDILDFCFYIDKELDINIGLEELMTSDKSVTLGNLYDSIR